MTLSAPRARVTSILWRVPAAVVVVGLISSSCGSDDVSTVGAGGESSSGLHEVAWEPVAASPLTARNEVTVVWTGHEVLVVGGTDFVCGEAASCGAPDTPKFRDGAAYDPVADSWRRIAEAPVGFTWAATAVLEGAVYFSATIDWTDEQVLLSYSLVEDSWSVLDPLPGYGGWWDLVATDTALIAYLTSDEVESFADRVFDPATGVWSELPDDPLGPAFDRTMIWTGSHLYLFDHELVDQPGSESPSITRAARFDPRSGAWERLADSEILGTGPWLVEGDQVINPVLGCADGGEVNNYGRCLPYGGVFDSTAGTWSELPDAPGRGDKDVFSGAGAVGSDSAVIFGVGQPAFDAVTGQWFDMPDVGPGPGRVVWSVGADAFVFGGTRSGSGGTELVDDAWIWRSGRT